MYDDLMEQDPKMRKIREESEAKGKAKGIAEGIAKGIAKGKAEALAEGMALGEAKVLQTKVETLQETLISIVEERFPPLTEIAQEKVVRIKEPSALKLLLRLVTTAPDEGTVRTVLSLAA